MDVNTYDLTKEEEVHRYITDKKIFNNIFKVEEIGNGNMNYVYRITDSISHESTILKYAANHTRISKDIPVSTDRIQIEASAISFFSNYVQEYVPNLRYYDETNHCILMNDFSNYSILRELLLEHGKILNFAEYITDYLIHSILPSSELVLDKLSRSKLKEEFMNPLCETTKIFVFTDPFDSQSSTNAIHDGNRNFMYQTVFHDQLLINEIKYLKDIFSNKKQALLHGDLHTGSIFTDGKKIIVFDFEFAFIGPIGFDLGNLIAHFIFSWLYTKVSTQKESNIEWIEGTIEKTVNLFIQKFKHQWNKLIIENIVDESIDINTYLKEIIQDAASFTGVELIRRVIGIAHVPDMSSIQYEADQIRAERIAVQTAKYYILNKSVIHDGLDFIKVLHENFMNIHLS